MFSSSATIKAIASPINLVVSPSPIRIYQSCNKCPTLWLAGKSLAVIISTTPFNFLASDMSIFNIFALGYLVLTAAP